MNHPRVDETFSNALRAELVSRVEKTPRGGTRNPAPMWVASAALAGAGILGGIAAGAGGWFVAPDSQQISSQPSALASYKAEDTLAAFSGVNYDYDPVRSPEALAALSQVIVEGSVKGVRAGRTGAGINTIVLIVDIGRVVQGELAHGNDGNVYLELPAAGHPDPLYYAKAFPESASVVAYMTAAAGVPSPEGIDVKIENPAAGRPAGQILYLPSGPQGLVLQAGEQDVVWPLTGARASGEIADTLPGGTLIAE